MNRIDRLYRKALKGLESKKAREALVEGIKEIGAWFSSAQNAYKSGKKMQLSDPDQYAEFIDEMEREFG